MAADQRVRVGFIAKLEGGNPYMRGLASGLRAAGVEVVPFGLSTVYLHRLIGRGAPRLIHFHWFQPLIMARGGLKRWAKYVLFRLQLAAARAMGVRVVWTAHDLHDHDRRARSIDDAATRAVAGASSAVVAHAPAVKRIVAERFGRVGPSRIGVIAHGNYDAEYDLTIDRASARVALGWRADDFVFLFFGNVRAYKGIVDLVGAFRSIQGPGLRLVIAGRPFGPDDEAVVRGAIGGDGRIGFEAGFIEDRRLSTLIAGCDAVVLPYRNILTSGAAVLAMTMGRAVIAPRIGCFPDFLGESGGVTYDPAAGDGLRGALIGALERRGELEGMGARNRRVAEWDSWERVGRMHREVYLRAMSGEACGDIDDWAGPRPPDGRGGV